MSDVIHAPFHANQLGSLAAEIKELIAEYAGSITLAEAVGVLDLVKYELIAKHNKD